MKAYYNEIDGFCCDWISNLMDAGLITPGKIDDRSIAEIGPDDVAGFDRVHLFAGIAGWDLALRLAGWPDDRPVWSGSAPCQPFSAAGQRKGHVDERHLWPEFRRLIEGARPPVVFGEQVASAEVVGTQLEADFVVAVRKGEFARANRIAKRLVRSRSFHFWARWIDAVCGDLEGIGYAVRPEVLGAHSVRSPHIRQRLWWVADADGRDACTEGLQRGGKHRQQPQDGGAGRRRLADREEHGRRQGCAIAPRRDEGTGAQGAWVGFADHRGGGVDDPGGERCGRREGVHAGRRQPEHASPVVDGPSQGGMGDAERRRLGERSDQTADQLEAPDAGQPLAGAGPHGQLGDAGASRLSPRQPETIRRARGGHEGRATQQPSRSPWADLVWLPCADGKARPTESTFQRIPDGLSDELGYLRAEDGSLTLSPLVRGTFSRVGRLRGYGNAIVPAAVAAFIASYIEAKKGRST